MRTRHPCTAVARKDIVANSRPWKVRMVFADMTRVCTMNAKARLGCVYGAAQNALRFRTLVAAAAPNVRSSWYCVISRQTWRSLRKR